MMRSVLLAAAVVAGLTCGAAIDIDCGRQLFVDDYLVESAEGVARRWNRPVKADAPVITPAFKPYDLVAATDGGLWWDPKLGKFRLWYQANWCGDIHYAESPDLLRWEFPDLGVVPGTNRVFPDDNIDSWCVSPDYAAADPYARWCLHISEPGAVTRDVLFDSADGRHFRRLGVGGYSGDRSSMYYDPFLAGWVFSLRDFRKGVGRSRRRFVSRTFGGADCVWDWDGSFVDRLVPGERRAGLPRPDEWLVATNGVRRSLYSFNAVAYESLMLGVMEILYNTPGDNGDCMKVGLPKQTGLHFCFSRDGKTYEPRKEADLAPEGWGSGRWDTGYLSCIGGVCAIKDERLWFYYTGLHGDGRRLDQKRWQRNGMYSCGALGYATLRRDGFAAMVATGDGVLVTKPVRFSGGHLFVNADCTFGSLAVEVLDEAGKVVPGFGEADCRPLEHRDTTKVELTWKGGDLAGLAGRAVRFRFHLGAANLYSFWVSPSSRGESRGYVAAGGPAYPGLRDL